MARHIPTPYSPAGPGFPAPVDGAPDPAPSARDRGRLERFRLLRAELEILTQYDRARARAGHDYGSGQRAGELARRRRDLAGLVRALELAGFRPLELEPASTARELGEAFERAGRPRLERARADLARFTGPGASTAPTARTVRVWLELAPELERGARLERDGGQ